MKQATADFWHIATPADCSPLPKRTFEFELPPVDDVSPRVYGLHKVFTQCREIADQVDAA